MVKHIALSLDFWRSSAATGPLERRFVSAILKYHIHFDISNVRARFNEFLCERRFTCMCTCMYVCVCVCVCVRVSVCV